jgi:hypothetical protein
MGKKIRFREHQSIDWWISWRKDREGGSQEENAKVIQGQQNVTEGPEAIKRERAKTGDKDKWILGRRITCMMQNLWFSQRSLRILEHSGTWHPRRVPWSKFHTEDPQILGATVKNSVATATWCAGLMRPSFRQSRPSFPRLNISVSHVAVRGLQNYW